MTRQKGAWITKDQAKFVILHNLVLSDKPLESVFFEKSEQPIPHASVAKILPELQKKKLIKKISSRTSRRGLKVPSFEVTLLGLLVWFVNDNKYTKFLALTNRFQYVEKILPIISKKWQLLSEYYYEEVMMRLLIKVISSIHILAGDPIILKYKTFYRGVTIEFKNTQEYDVYESVLELVESDTFKKGFEMIVNFGFFLELYKLHETESYYYDRQIGLKRKTKITDWLKVVKSDNQLTNQILIGFNTMKEYSERTHVGIVSDVEFIQGKGRKYCKVCSEMYDDEITESMHRSRLINEHNLNKIIEKDYLFSRSLFENELEFEKKKIFGFNEFFKVR